MKIKLLLFIAFSAICNAQIVTIPDANFKAALLSASPSNQIASTGMPYAINVVGSIVNSGYTKIDVNNDGEIQVSEAESILSLKINNKDIADLTGIEAFVNLVNLDCRNNLIANLSLAQNPTLKYLDCGNNLIMNLNVSQNTNLLRIFCSDNQLSNLNLSQNLLLNMLICNNNQLTALDVSQNLNLLHLNGNSNQFVNLDFNNNSLLKVLGLDDNQISTIDVSNLIDLEYLGCGSNQLTNLDISSNTALEGLYCDNNLLTDLNTSNNTNLISISCGSNLFTDLDFSHLQLLSFLFFENNINLISANLKNNNQFWDNLYVYFNNNPNLEYLCVDDEDMWVFENILNNNTNTNNCHINSYCSFIPGGTFYEISGTTKYDFNANGCDINDVTFSSLKFTITDGINSGALITDQSGNYFIPVQEGSQTITPNLENSTYFTISPTSLIVDFPAQTSPFSQNFCVTANGVHSDVEVVVLPTVPARPGFDAHYKIVYRNKGNQVENGIITFTYDNAVLDYVSSNPVYNSQATDSFVWNYTNLQPFQTGEIEVVLNVNSPTETPAVNSDDVLNYTATVATLNTDETPNDNTSFLNQVVVNSYDPNDKTCLQGTTITPSMVGGYVHYLIRFENKGTANAQNIVVKDMIDTSKFDINTLIPIKGSHSFETKIANTNKVEFIFQNINLPFDDANNDGYVSFKIKTKSNLVLGDSFSNLANIYFDYNFPIVTNNYTTTIQNTLSIPENNFSNGISVYPNPVKGILQFQTETAVIKVEVYDIAGRILSSNSISENKMDLNELKTGNYILKFYTEKGIMITKIIKE